jgi:hypothetical protein
MFYVISVFSLKNDELIRKENELFRYRIKTFKCSLLVHIYLTALHNCINNIAQSIIWKCLIYTHTVQLTSDDILLSSISEKYTHLSTAENNKVNAEGGITDYVQLFSGTARVLSFHLKPSCNVTHKHNVLCMWITSNKNIPIFLTKNTENILKSLLLETKNITNAQSW